MCLCTYIVTLFVAFCFVVRTFEHSDRTDINIAGTRSLMFARFTYSDGSSRRSANVSTSYISTAATVNNNHAINSSTNR